MRRAEVALPMHRHLGAAEKPVRATQMSLSRASKVRKCRVPQAGGAVSEPWLIGSILVVAEETIQANAVISCSPTMTLLQRVLADRELLPGHELMAVVSLNRAPRARATVEAREELLRRVLAPSQGLLRPGHRLMAAVSLNGPHGEEQLPPPPARAPRQRRSRTRRATRADQAEDCALCCCRYTPGERLRELPCGHAFHRGVTERCGGVDLWLVKTGSCPLCRETH
jgi:hypothetical protein